jgi:hypothetical protein
MPFVRHDCDNRLCCNPAHLVEGTHLQNMADMRERGRSRKGEPMPIGQDARAAKLADEDVREIRSQRQRGAKLREIAEAFNVCTSSVSAICRGERWGHVQ